MISNLKFFVPFIDINLDVTLAQDLGNGNPFVLLAVRFFFSAKFLC